MKKAMLTSFTILCLFSTLFLMECKISVKAELIALYVDDDNVTGPWDGTREYPYQNITNALEHAIDGDTIFVRAGKYYENVVVDKSVKLVGEDRDWTIVDANKNGSVISVKANNVNISNFTIQNSGGEWSDRGILIDRSSGNDISHNTIKNNNDGISLYFSGNNVVSGNTITNNNNDGISLLYFSGNNVVSGNTITNNNNDGISLLYSGNNVVSGNTITYNTYGVWLLESSDNKFYHNNFVNNTDQVDTQQYSSNVWDNGAEGNYWSDYIGADLYSGPYQNETGSDGIGDSPYIVNDENKDNYPLMGIFSDFPVTLKGEMYHVTTICNSTISEFRFEIGPETGNKIIRFNATGKDSTVGFSRVTIPTELMNYPYIVLVGVEEINATKLDVSNETYVYLYFTYIHSTRIRIISSRTLHLYNELLHKHRNLNGTYYDLLKNYSRLLGNYSQLQESYRELNNSYSKNVHNIRSLMYILAATTAIFIIATIYLSKHAHAGKTEVFEDRQRAQEAV